MKAALLRTIPALELSVEEVPDPVPERDRIVVAVEACGVCGTDLHIMEGASYRPELPFVLGHEIVGTVVAVGPGVEQVRLGDRVAATQFVGCGDCPMCRGGDIRLCERGALVSGVLGLPGGFAERVLLHEAQLVDIPASLDSHSAAALVDAGTTAHNVARVLRTKVASGDGLHLVVGAGPVGLLTAEILRFADYEVVIAETNPLRRAEASRLGYSTSTSLADLNESFASVIDCAGAPGIVEAELALLRPHGLYFPVGYSVVPAFDLAMVSRRELIIWGIRSGTRQDLGEVLLLAAEGGIRVPRVDAWQLEAINAALSSLRNGDVPGKAIIVNGANS